MSPAPSRTRTYSKVWYISSLSIFCYLSQETEGDKVIWRLIEVCLIFGEVGYVYQLWSLNNRVLAVDGNGKFSAEIYNDALMTHQRTLVSIQVFVAKMDYCSNS